MRLRTVLQVTAPLVAVATLMLGLRVGAKTAVRAAVVFGAPIAQAPKGEKPRLAWQLLTFLDDRGVKEVVAMKGLTVTARTKKDVATWTGATNADGIAELGLELDGLATGEDVWLDVKAEGDPVPIASGHAAWDPAPRTHEELGAAPVVRPTKRTGEIGLNVFIEGGRLVTGFTTPAWVQVRPPAGVDAQGIEIAIAPEPGLRTQHEKVTTCRDGWAEIPLVAEAHVTGFGLKATAPSRPEIGGEWFGPLPVAAGAFFPSVDRMVPEDRPATAVLIAPNPRDVVYAEIDDASGRAYAAALPVAVEPGDPTPRARLTIPPLARGLHWLVVSGEPRGAETLAGAAIARPFLVTTQQTIDTQDPCSIGPDLASRATLGFPRWVALDGLPARSAGNRGKHRLGLFIAIVALTAAAMLEAILLAAASREARVQLQLAELDEGEDPEKVTAKPPGGGLAVAVLTALLGFALLAALLVAKG